MCRNGSMLQKKVNLKSRAQRVVGHGFFVKISTSNQKKHTTIYFFLFLPFTFRSLWDIDNINGSRNIVTCG